MQRQTTLAKPADIKRTWYLVDATDIPLGRLSSKIAVILMGKNKPTYTPNVDCGDYVVVINASKVKLTGPDPEHKKNYYNVSEYNGGLRTRSAGVMDCVKMSSPWVFSSAGERFLHTEEVTGPIPVTPTKCP